MAGHATLPLDQPPSAAFGLVLGIAGHAVGWPIPRGGAGQHRRRAGLLSALAGRHHRDRRARRRRWTICRRSRAILLDLTPRQILRVAGDAADVGLSRRSWSGSSTGSAPSRWTGRWTARSPGARPWLPAPATVHLGGTMEEIVAGRAGRVGRAARRAPAGAALPADPVRPVPGAEGQAHRLGLLPRAERQHGRHDRADRGPGRAVRARLPRSGSSAGTRWARPTFERHNPNLIGGDINGGEVDAAAAVLPPGPASRPVHHAGPEPLHLLVLDAAGRRRPRHVRLPRRPHRAAPSVLSGFWDRQARRGILSGETRKGTELMYERILVALDGSEIAERVLPQVEALAKAFGSTVILLQATTSPAKLMAELSGEIDLAPTIIDPSEILDEEKAEVGEYLEKTAGRLRRGRLEGRDRRAGGRRRRDRAAGSRPACRPDRDGQPRSERARAAALREAWASRSCTTPPARSCWCPCTRIERPRALTCRVGRCFCVRLRKNDPSPCPCLEGQSTGKGSRSWWPRCRCGQDVSDGKIIPVILSTDSAPAIAPTIRNGSAPVATASGSGASGGSWERSSRRRRTARTAGAAA